MIHSLQARAGRDETWVVSKLVKLKRLVYIPSTYAGIILLFIALSLISMPEMPSNLKDFLMVSFACVALLPGYKS